MLVDNLQQAITNPDDEYHLASKLDRTISFIREKPEIAKEQISNELLEADEADIEHCLFSTIESLSEWYYQKETLQSTSDRNFDLVKIGINGLKEVYEDANNRGWDNVTLVAINHRLRELNQLSGWDAEVDNDIRQLRDLLINDGLLTYSNQYIVFDSLDILIELSTPNNQDIIVDLYRECRNWAKEFRENQDLVSERDVLKRAIELRKLLDASPDEEQQRFIESIEEDIDSSEHHHRNASLLRSGIMQCREFLPSDKRSEWLRQLRIENRKGRSNMKPQSTGITPYQLQFQSEKYTAYYRSLRNQYSRTEAFFQLLRSNHVLVDYRESVEQEFQRLEKDPVYAMLSETFENDKGDIVEQNSGLFEVLDGFGDEEEVIKPNEEKMDDWTPKSYRMNVREMTAVLSRVLKRLIENNDVLETDFYRAFDHIEYIDPHREAYLLDTTIAFFEEDYSKALHIGMPQFEAAIRDLLEIKGETVNKNNPDGTTEPYPLGRLFTIIEENVDENLGSYLAHQYTEQDGLNLRNAIAHGEYPYPGDSFDYASVMLFDIFRTLVRTEDNYE